MKKALFALLICMGAFWLWSRRPGKGTSYEKTDPPLPDTAADVRSNWL